ncbi:MAG: LPXTG cell wall anchor domain-containing protein [Clostridiales bacterium]|nr:LPXTG cell wall anchor domain-containing protein [Clostridiales bacterium]
MKNMKNLCKHGLFMPLLALVLCMGLASTPAFAADVDEAESQVTTVADVESGDIENEELTEPNEGDDKEPTTENGDTETGEGDTSDAECTCTPAEDGTHDENCPQYKAPEVDPADGGDETDGNVTTEPGQDGDTSDAECNCTPAEDGTHDENCPQYKEPEVDPADGENDEDPEPAVCTCTTKCGETGNSECPVCAAGGECKATSSGVKWDEETGTLTITGNGGALNAADLKVNGEAVTNLKPNHLVIDGFSTVGNDFKAMADGLKSLEINNVGAVGDQAFSFLYNEGLKITVSNSKLDNFAFWGSAVSEVVLDNVDAGYGSLGYFAPVEGDKQPKLSVRGGHLSGNALMNSKLSELELNGVDITDSPFSGTTADKVTVTDGKLGVGMFNGLTAPELVLDNVTADDWAYPLNGTRFDTVTINNGITGNGALGACNMSNLVLNNVTIENGERPLTYANAGKVTVNGGSLGDYALMNATMSEIELNNTTVSNSAFYQVNTNDKGLSVTSNNSNLSEDALSNVKVGLYVKDGVIVKATTDSLQDLINKSEGPTKLVISGVIHSTGDSIRIAAGKDITLVTNGEAASIEAPDEFNDSLFVIENGGKLTIDDDKLTIKGAANGKTVDSNSASALVFQVNGELVLNNGTIIGGGSGLDNSKGAIVLNNGAKFTMTGGTIRDTKLYDWYSAPVFVGSGAEFIMKGGKITNNRNTNGAGGVAVVGWYHNDPSAKMTLSGGEISHNTTYRDAGGITLWGNADLYMNGGKIIGNTSHWGYGGGISVAGRTGDMVGVNKYYDPKCVFTMDGGEISGNYAVYGGGIYVNSNDVTLNAGLIADNTASETGGGIYVETPEDNSDANFTSAQLNNAVIHGNSATIMGGGMYFCPTGSSEQYVNKGPAIFDNTADGAADDLVSVALPSEPEDGKFVIVTERILGGGKVDWYLDGEVEELIANGRGNVVEGSERYNAETYAELVAAGKYQNIALKAIVSENAKQLALASGKLIITGNQAKRGGGVGSNGNVTIGDKDAPEYELNIDKVWEGVSEGEKKPVIIQLVIDGVKLDTIELSAENGWSASFTGLSEDLKDKLSVIELTTGYTVSYSELSEDGETLHITVTNSLNPQTPDPDPEPPTPEEEIPDVDIPLGEPPEEEIPDEEVPLGNVPQTGDNSAIWYVLAVLSVSGLAVLALVEKRKEQEG